MSSSERIRNVQVHRPVIYGSQSRLLSDAEKALAPPGHTHRWTVFFTSATSPPPPAASSSTQPPPIDMDYLPGGADDLSYLVKKVTFRLHETYPNPNRVCDKPPFLVSETGWGEFTVQVRLQFVQESGEKPLTLSHAIKLHHWGAPVEAPPAPPAGTAPPLREASGAASVGPSTGAGGGTRAGSEAGAGAGGVSTPAAATTGDGEQIKSEASTPARNATGTPATEGEGTEPPKMEEMTQPQTLSIASKYPVHAWQYDELVFSDPLPAFYTLLNQHPRHPFPPKTGGHAIKGKSTRDVTVEPPQTPAPAAEGSVGPAGGNNTPGGTVVVGIPGELGSADVPLEYSLAMEKGEWNKLDDVRVKIVEQMDRWRERLIAQEKELAKLKEEMNLA
ncbi:NuA4 histone H4 acetyltransferase complex and the SWR1 complex subunit [Saitozyma podzolica]|uniref:Protein AF-9 homolog n=1 Tax=Saitozyma podzolica TaxID=1890683 RepID=A0A427YL79_9TREE|nr:NuA4 histone H4 acetyltransferase complex and the SWR1 complex subunit [Saitozyma podzolica]